MVDMATRVNYNSQFSVIQYSKSTRTEFDFEFSSHLDFADYRIVTINIFIKIKKLFVRIGNTFFIKRVF